MSEFKGTKGEWKVENESHEVFGVDNYNHIMAGNGYFDGKSKSGFSIQTFISDSDARLIVNSPKLLKSLQVLVSAARGICGEHVTGLMDLDNAADMAEKAINEALGE